MSGFTGEVAQFTKAHQDVETTKTDLDSQLRSLQNLIQGEVLPTWDGAGKQSFEKLMVRFDEKATDQFNALQQIGELLQQAGSTYETVDMETQEDFSGGGFSALDE